MSPYFVYLLRCSDGTFYTGICTDLERRLDEHNRTAKGARYTRVRRPVSLAYAEPCPDRSAALKREHALRKLNRQEKQALAAAYAERPGSQSPAERVD